MPFGYQQIQDTACSSYFTGQLTTASHKEYFELHNPNVTVQNDDDDPPDKEHSDEFEGSVNDVKQPVFCGSFQVSQSTGLSGDTVVNSDVQDLEASLESNVYKNNSSLVSEDIDSKEADKIINEHIMGCTSPPDDCQLDGHKYEQPIPVTVEKELIVKAEMVYKKIWEKWKSIHVGLASEEKAKELDLIVKEELKLKLNIEVLVCPSNIQYQLDGNVVTSCGPGTMLECLAAVNFRVNDNQLLASWEVMGLQVHITCHAVDCERVAREIFVFYTKKKSSWALFIEAAFDTDGNKMWGKNKPGYERVEIFLEKHMQLNERCLGYFLPVQKFGFKFIWQKLPQLFLPSVSVCIMGGTLAGWELLHHEHYIVQLLSKFQLTLVVQLEHEHCKQFAANFNSELMKGDRQLPILLPCLQSLKVTLVECLKALEPWMFVTVSEVMRYISCVKGVPASHLSCVRKITAFAQLTEALKSTVNDKACDFGSGLLFDILSLLIQPTLEDQKRHLLVKLIVKLLHEVADLCPYMHKVLVEIETKWIDEDYLGKTSAATTYYTFFRNLNAEVVGGVKMKEEDVSDHLTWSIICGKFTKNHNHYNLLRDYPCHLSNYMSEILGTALSNMESSKYVYKEADIDLLPLNFDKIASYYFLSGSKTCEFMLGDISTTLEDHVCCCCDGIIIQLLRNLSSK